MYAPLSGTKIFGYCLGNFGVSLAWGFLSSFLLYFYTDIAGIPAAAVTTLILTARIWDAANDPLIGVLADRTNSPWGRYRPWLLLGSVPFGILLVLTLTARANFTPDAKLAYAYITYFSLILAYTMVQIPLNALMGVMTHHSGTRTVLGSARSIIMTVTGLIVGVTGLPLIRLLGKGDLTTGFRNTAVCIGAISILTLWAAFASIRETVFAPPNQRITPKKIAATILFNGPLLAILLGQLIGGFVLYGRMSASIYYFQYYAGNVDLYQTYSFIWFASMMCGAFYALYLSQRLGQRGVVCLTSFIGGLALVLTYYIHPAQPFLFHLFTAIGGGLLGCRMSALFALIPEAVEYGQQKTGVRADGVVSSSIGLIMKLGTALGSVGVGLMLTTWGYTPFAIQSPQVLTGFNLMMTVIPGAGIMLTTIPFLFTSME